ncbi:MAG: peptidylprolyl isomerase [Proteobacteria bacterium]|nr:peptidylprolyl isomerase [Pseudomonadota bacterium]
MSQKVISFHYTLKDDKGAVIESSKGGEAMAVLTGSDSILPKVEKTLLAMGIGDKKSVKLSADEAYGPYDERLVGQAGRNELPEQLEVGMQFTAQQGAHMSIVTVTAFDDNVVHLDANHPLAGKALEFDLEVTGSRDATAEELSHGHAHGPGGHHHH